MINKSIIASLVLCFLSFFDAFPSKLDSLLTQLNGNNTTNEKVVLLSHIFNEVLDENPEEAQGFARQELIEANKTEDSIKIADALLHIGLSYDYQSQYDSALFYYYNSYQFYENVNHAEGVANALLNVGIVNYFQGNYTGALRNYFDVVKLLQESEKEAKLASVYSNIGVIFVAQKKYEKALEFYKKSLDLDLKIQNKRGVATSYNNNGIVYRQMGEYDKAIQAYFMALKYKLELGNKSDIANTYTNIGMLYFYEGDYSKSLEYAQLAYDLEKEIGDERSMAGSMINLGETLIKLGELNKGLSYLEKGIELSEKHDNKEYLKFGYEGISEAYSAKGDYKKAYEYQKRYAAVKDSLLSFEKNQELAQLETQFQFDQKDKEIELLKREQQIDRLRIKTEEKEVEKRNVFIYSLAGGLFFVLIIVSLLYNRYRVKKTANIALAQQNDEISKQKVEIQLKSDMLEEKNVEITDSINYAKRIQQALFKADEFIKPNVKDYFILFKPKDIVSGDFYWAALQNDILYIAVADCTGHGVPGAFMSLLGNTFLNQILNDGVGLTPASILDKLRDKIITELGQSGEEGKTKDGMDISLCKINRRTNKLEWAGANNSLWIVKSNREFIEYQPDKQPVGYYYMMENFTNHQINLDKGDKIYMFTDGYADQFGGDKGKKLKYKAFKSAVISGYEFSMDDQKKSLEILIENWKGELEQIDDICVMGIAL